MRLLLVLDFLFLDFLLLWGWSCGYYLHGVQVLAIVVLRLLVVLTLFRVRDGLSFVLGSLVRLSVVLELL